MRNVWIAIALGMSVLMTGLGAWEAQAVSSSSLAGLGTLSKQKSPCRKRLVWGLVAAAVIPSRLQPLALLVSTLLVTGSFPLLRRCRPKDRHRSQRQRQVRGLTQ